MSAKHTLETMVRNTWLAGLGSIESSVGALSKSIDAAQKKSNNIYNELLTRGEEIQNKISDAKVDIEARGKKFIGTGSEESHEEKLAKLNVTVDHLTTVVVKLIEKHNAAASGTKQTQITKNTEPKSAAKVVPKAATKAKPAGTANKVAPKSAAKAVPKATTKAKPVETANKVAPKSAAKAVPKATTNVKPAETAVK
nr:hypothetical protein [uncultured Glaciecola sp.]